MTINLDMTVAGSRAGGEKRDSRPAAAAHRGVAVDITLRLGALMLAVGSPTDSVERAMRSTATALGLAGPTAVVSFGVIALSVLPGGGSEPLTAIRLVTQRGTDFRRLMAAVALARKLRDGPADPDKAAAEISRIENLPRASSTLRSGLTQAASAGATALLFGGSSIDGLATVLVAVVVVAMAARLDRSGLPPFFRSLIGPLASSLLVAAVVSLGPQVDPVPVLAGSLVPFLPGAALVAGMRDLIDQSTVSGAARLTEAILLGAAVAAGAAVGIGLASEVHVSLSVGSVVDPEGWSLPSQVGLAAIACGAWSACLGGTRPVLLTASALGAVGWLAFVTTISLGYGIVVATALVGLALGGGARLLERDDDAPTVQWVVPASLPLLPGLPLVYGMLADNAIDGVIQLAMAGATALALGSGIAAGDAVLQYAGRVGTRLRWPGPRMSANLGRRPHSTG
jgi:uncharacterized membrane protein YjjP (DUF1212 family)